MLHALRHRPWSTICSAPATGLAGVLSLRLYRVFQASTKRPALIVHGVLLAIAGSLLAFLVYNLLAGGNPPKRARTVEDA